jgi:hypothetical protein
MRIRFEKKRRREEEGTAKDAKDAKAGERRVL